MRPRGMRFFSSFFTLSDRGSVMGVAMKPGATAFTVILREAISMAMALVRPTKPALADVVCLAGVAHLRHDTGYVDDAACAGAHHGGKGLLDTQVRASKICANYRIPVFLLHAHGE